MIDQRPPSSPPCWGRQYDDNDKECTSQCEYRLSCKPTFFRNNSTSGAVSLPMYPTPAPLPQPTWPPAPPSFTPPQAQQPIRLGTVQPPATQPYQAIPAPPPHPMTFAQQPTTAPTQLPPANNLAPGSVHSPYFMQYYSPYPGESIVERLGKHMLLRLGQILFHELAAFFGLWKWPPRKK